MPERQNKPSSLTLISHLIICVKLLSERDTPRSMRQISTSLLPDNHWLNLRITFSLSLVG